MPATSPTQSAPTWPVVKRSWRMMTISEPFRILFLTRLRKTSSSHRGKTWLRSRKRGGVLWMLSLSSSSSSDFANDAVAPLLLPPAGDAPQAAAGRGTIYQHRSRRWRRRRSRLIRAPSICAGLLNPVRIRSKAFSVRRQYGVTTLGDTPDLDFVGLFFELGEVVRHLHSEPYLRA